MLKVTLSEMADGGIHDQIGGGFARYSVDAQWLVPHFEKMLYDNAQLARIYLWAGIELEEPRFVDVARSTLGYLLGDLRHPNGGFFSAEDADSEGVEGKFYVWTTQELERALGPRTGPRRHGSSVPPHTATSRAPTSSTDPTNEPWTERIESMRARLDKHRTTRVRPGLDDKVVASWNGLAIKALAEAGAAGRCQLLGGGEGDSRFVLDHMVLDGVLRRSWRRAKRRARLSRRPRRDGAGTVRPLCRHRRARSGTSRVGLTLAMPKRFADRKAGSSTRPSTARA